jgi:hypothetical protein
MKIPMNPSPQLHSNAIASTQPNWAIALLSRLVSPKNAIALEITKGSSFLKA